MFMFFRRLWCNKPKVENTLEYTTLKRKFEALEKEHEALKTKHAKLESTFNEIKDRVTDPISMELFTDPYIAGDGHVYEWKHIYKWLVIYGKQSSPLTGLFLKPPLYPCYRTKQITRIVENQLRE